MRKITIGLVVLILFVLGGAAGANQKFVQKQINVLYGNIKIYVDGKELTTDQEAFILAQKGVTMVPVRAISEALGKEVTWDPATNSVYLGKKPQSVQTPQENQPQPVWLEDLPVLRNVGPFYRQEVPLRIAGRRFGHGIAVDLSKDSAAETVLDLNGKYEKLTGYIGLEDKASESSGGYSLAVYADDVKVYQSPVIKPGGYPQYLTITTKWTKRLSLRLQWENAGMGKYSEVTAALADWQLQ